jgi:hypothetical protein
MKQNLTTEEMGKYLVLRLSFSGVSPEGDVMKNFRKCINNSVQKFSEKYHDAGLLDELVDIDAEDCLSSMQRLFDAVELSGREMYLIVDECDAFVNRLLLSVDTSQPDLGRQQYEHVVSGKESMLRNWGNVIKEGTVRTIARAFFTGVVPQAFSDGLSSMNMVKDLTFDSNLEGLFGLTEGDVSRGLDMITHLTAEQRAQHLEQMRVQYDGYRFVPTQKEPLFNSQYVLYYLSHLDRKGAPPAQLIDPAVSDGTDNVAQFLISNYKAGAPYTPLDFLLDITSPEETGTFLAEVTPAFHSKDLFQANTVSKSLVSLAFFHGFLTYKSDKDQRSVLTIPNLVMQSVYARTLFAGLPTQRLEQLEAMLYSGKPDLKEFKRVVMLGYDEAVKAGGKAIGVAAIKAFVDRLR